MWTFFLIISEATPNSSSTDNGELQEHEYEFEILIYQQ